jgi:hypothetical protein
MRLYLKATSTLATLALIAVPIWAKPKIFPLAEQCSQGKVSACRELEKIAAEDPDVSVRRSAASFLTDRAILEKIAAKDPDASVRNSAAKQLGRVTNIPALAEQCRLGKLAYSCRELKQIAAEDPDASVRSAATSQLTDLSILTKIAAKDPDASVRNSAAEHENVRRLAVGALDKLEAKCQRGEQSACRELERTAVEDPDATVRRNVLLDLLVAGHQSDVNLAKIGVEDPDASVRDIAARNLFDRTVLAKIAAGDADASVRSSAAKRLEYVRLSELNPIDLIRSGDISRIPDLLAYLQLFGSKATAEEYINCGQPDLRSAGEQWASRNRYHWVRGKGSQVVTWGGGQ